MEKISIGIMVWIIWKIALVHKYSKKREKELRMYYGTTCGKLKAPKGKR